MATNPAQKFDDSDVPGNAESAPPGRDHLQGLEGGGQSGPTHTGKLAAVPDSPDGEPAKTGPNLKALEGGKGKQDQSGSASPASGTKETGSIKTRIKEHRGLLAGVAISAAVSIIVFIVTLLSGPFQFLQLDHILERNFTGSNNTSSIRVNRLFRAAKTGNIGETRVNRLGSKIFGATKDQLKDIGIEFQTNGSGLVTSATIDTEALKKSFPELEGMTPEQQQGFLAEKFGLSVDDLPIPKTGSIFNIDTTKFGVGATRALVKNSLYKLDDGKIITGIKLRVTTDYFDLPSLFHPYKLAKAAIYKKLKGAARVTAEENDEKARDTTLQEPELTPDAVAAEDNVKSALESGGKAAVTSLLVLQGAVCLVHGIANDAVALNRAMIVLPAALQAADKIAIGEQIEKGFDFDESQAGATANSFMDSTGKNIWGGEALLATEGLATIGSTDLPTEFAQAFSGNTTADGIKSATEIDVAGVDVTAAACSQVGQLIGLVATVGLLISSFADFGGSAWAYAGIKGAEAAATAGIIYMLHQELTPLLADKAIVPLVLSGPLGGNILAYGARELANIGARSSGGIDQPNTNTRTVTMAQQEEENQQFNSESVFSKIFDPSDNRTLVGRMMDGVSGSFTQNIARMATSLFHFGNVFSGIKMLFEPKAEAATAPYNWGFDQYGIPDSVAEDPQFADPYTNAQYVATNLLDPGASDSHGTKYTDKAMDCFGVSVNNTDANNEWQVVPSGDVNPGSSKYTEAHCNDTDTNWERMQLFVFDSRTMDAAACYDGDTDSCNNTGSGDNPVNTGAPAPTGTGTGTGTTIPPGTPVGDSSTQCDPRTRDIGIYTGYQGGNPVQVRLCSLPNLPCSNAECNNGFGITGADGHALVNSTVSKQWYDLVQAGIAAGLPMSSNSSFRTMANQQQICATDMHNISSGGSGGCADGNYTYVAQPGYSNHQMGYAIDFSNADTGFISTSDPVFVWLSANAATYGMYNYPPEPWHWSPTGN